ncbi:uncharacterized protein LOC127750781 [Frankliniella occidentalis]|uniref:Uncharacterized protein LOC127750781 n=1 Tax=Frankliniella occidentalis TaxID=133901 RepID=A0A9C6X4Z3_FRAOC|nr:uncharacterized protein LOC127750781 [Frankliniella occidentalis]
MEATKPNHLKRPLFSPSKSPHLKKSRPTYSPNKNKRRVRSLFHSSQPTILKSSVNSEQLAQPLDDSQQFEEAKPTRAKRNRLFPSTLWRHNASPTSSTTETAIVTPLKVKIPNFLNDCSPTSPTSSTTETAIVTPLKVKLSYQPNGGNHRSKDCDDMSSVSSTTETAIVSPIKLKSACSNATVLTDHDYCLVSLVSM